MKQNLGMHILFRMNFVIFLFVQPALVFGRKGLRKKFRNNYSSLQITGMRLIRSFEFAVNGIKQCFISEPNFRIHFGFAVTAIIFAAFFQVSIAEWIAVGFCIAFVIVMEMLNTAIEKLCDVVHPGIHPGIKKVKDIAAGAVLVAAVFSAVTGLIIFVPKIIIYLKTF